MESGVGKSPVIRLKYTVIRKQKLKIDSNRSESRDSDKDNIWCHPEPIHTATPYKEIGQCAGADFAKIFWSDFRVVLREEK